MIRTPRLYKIFVSKVLLDSKEALWGTNNCFLNQSKAPIR
jgi:hypothetical protein